MKTEKLIREIHPEIRIINEAEGVADYVASDETLDCYREIIRASGWRFNLFAKNAPFVDSHDYSTIGRLLGRVEEFRIEGGRLVERVRWAKDMPESPLASFGWKMTVAGFLKAVSVGFYPTRYVSKWDPDQNGFIAQVKELGLSAETAAQVRTIYIEQEQIELSSCIIGANPNALAKAYKAGAITEEDLDSLSRQITRAKTDSSAASPAEVEESRRRARDAFWLDLNKLL